MWQETPHFNQPTTGMPPTQEFTGQEQSGQMQNGTSHNYPTHNNNQEPPVSAGQGFSGPRPQQSPIAGNQGIPPSPRDTPPVPGTQQQSLAGGPGGPGQTWQGQSTPSYPQSTPSQQPSPSMKSGPGMPPGPNMHSGAGMPPGPGQPGAPQGMQNLQKQSYPGGPGMPGQMQNGPSHSYPTHNNNQEPPVSAGQGFSGPRPQQSPFAGNQVIPPSPRDTPPVPGTQQPSLAGGPGMPGQTWQGQPTPSYPQPTPSVQQPGPIKSAPGMPPGPSMHSGGGMPPGPGQPGAPQGMQKSSYPGGPGMPGQMQNGSSHSYPTHNNQEPAVSAGQGFSGPRPQQSPFAGNQGIPPSPKDTPAGPGTQQPSLAGGPGMPGQMWQGQPSPSYPQPTASILQPGPSMNSGPGMPPGPSMNSGLGMPPGMNSGPGMPPGPSMNSGPGMPPGPSMNSGPGMPPGPSMNSGPGMPPGAGMHSGAGMPPGLGMPPGPGMPSGPGMPPGPGQPYAPQGMQKPSYPGGPGMPGQMQNGPGGPPPHYPNQNLSGPGQGFPGQRAPLPPYGSAMPPAPGQMYPQQPQQPGQQQPLGGGGGPGMQNQMWAGQSAPSYPQPTAQQQQKRLDPDQMPSAIGVMQEDQQTRGGLFQTNLKGQLPPLVTTKFQVDDQGNASPRFVRSTMYSVPAQPDMLKQTAIPFALVINPFEAPAKDEQQLSWVDLGPNGPIRCIRCKAYISPLMQFIDGGRRFQCLLCTAITEVPADYFQHLDHTGSRIDKYERPELCKGSYEIIATIEYCRGNVLPKEPAFIFVIDVSYTNVNSGLVSLLCSHMKTLLEALPSHTPVGFITYNSKVHFFNIDPSLTQPQMVIVPDVADMFMPLLTGFLVPKAEATTSIDILMEQIPTLFADTKDTESVIGPAIQAGMEALKASERVGKLLVLHSSLPTSDVAPGKLRTRENDRKLLGTDKEKAVLTPQSTYYNNLGQDCVQNGVSVDLYLFNNSYIDVATIGQVARITGGCVNKYTYFQADIDGPRVVGELTYHLSRPIGFDAVMRVRTSTGVRPTDFHGHFFMANTTDVEIAAIDSNKSIAVEVKHDDKLNEDGVYIQIALLYTSIFGQRRLRIHNLALNTCNQMADLYRNCELDTITNFLAKQCISKCVESTPQSIKDGVINRCAQMLATYRKHCANPSMPGQLILPECLKLLPLYINCVLRSDAVSGNHEITPDDRSWLMYTTMTMGVATSVYYFYPKLIPVAGPDVSPNHEPIRCSYDKLKDDSAFILENGIYIFLWIGAAVNPDWLQDIFGVSNLAQLNVETITELPDHVDSDESLRLRAFIRQLRNDRNRHMRLTLVRQKDKMEPVMKRFLIEDRSSDGQPSYVDFLCHMHKEIRALLNQ